MAKLGTDVIARFEDPETKTRYAIKAKLVLRNRYFGEAWKSTGGYEGWRQWVRLDRDGLEPSHAIAALEARGFRRVIRWDWR
jgi:hypothetical protein